MKLIVGLGNPEEKYVATRHNLGWLTLDALGKKLPVSGWRLDKKSNALLAKGRDFVFVKPQTYMNSSGLAVKSLVTSFSVLKLSDLWLIHDDVDLPLGKIKIVKKRGSAGHRGVDSVIQALGSIDFVRFRLGVGYPHANRQIGIRKKISRFVLAPFLPTEEDELRRMIKKTVKAVDLALIEGIDSAMNRYN